MPLYRIVYTDTIIADTPEDAFSMAVTTATEGEGEIFAAYAKVEEIPDSEA